MAEGRPCVRYGELYTTYEGVVEEASSHVGDDVYAGSKKLEPDEVLVALTGENNVDIGRAVYNATGETLAFGGDLLAVKGRNVSGAYLAMAINSPAVGPQRTKASTGNIIVHLSAAKAATLLIPVPPLAEQRRIVERVNGLMPLAEGYGELEDAREALDAALPDRLRRSVLQQAVQGKLVPQDPADEPASALLGRIRAERRRLIADKKMKAPKGGESVIFAGSDGRRYEKRVDAKGRESDAVCIEDEIPFDVPDGWEWARIGTLFEMGAGKNIKASEISEQPTEDRPFRCYGGNGVRGYVAFFNQEGDCPIIGRQGALCGNVQRATGKFYATEHAVVSKCLAGSDVSWACLFLTALNLNQYATATAQPGLAVSKIVELLIPLPPLAEQRRIAERVKDLTDLLTNQ